MQCGRLDTDMCLKGVAPGRDDVELSWINSVMERWRIKPYSELAPGA